jgi:hypothetical protein
MVTLKAFTIVRWCTDIASRGFSKRCELLPFTFVALINNRSCSSCESLKVGEACRHFLVAVYYETINVGPCHHGMARPQAADGGTASYMEGSCE